jgi:glycosyltransferase involved in cell wall biosynthesis
LNILHISTPLSWRGGEQQIAYLAEGLREKGHEQIFLCAQGGEMEIFCYENDFTCFPFQPSLLQLQSNISFLRRICRNYEIDLIHVHDSKGHTQAFAAALMGNRIPLVVSRRVDFPMGKSWLSRKKYNHPSVKKIICVSGKIKEITGAGILNKEVLTVVYDGVSVEAPADEIIVDLHQEFNIPEDYRIVGNIAALAPHKDYFTFTDTAARMLQMNPKIKFLAVGEGPQRRDIEAYIKSKNMQEHIILTGFRNDAKAIMAGLDLLLFTSETEGLGSSILDAYVRKIPVVATAAGGVPEIAVNGKTALLAPVKDAEKLSALALQVLEDKELRNELCLEAAEFVKQFDISRMVEGTLEVYKEIVRK